MIYVESIFFFVMCHLLTIYTVLVSTMNPGISWGSKGQERNGQTPLWREATNGPDLFRMSSKG